MMQTKTATAAFAALAALVLAGCSGTRIPTPADILPPKTPPDRRVHVGLQPYVRAGSTDGYLQTPDGGAPGTSSRLRPTLAEIGISNTWEVGAKLDTFWRRHGVTLEWSRFFLNHGSATLATDLTSQAMPFPAGTLVSSDSALTYLGIHYSYLFEVQLSPCDRVELRPGFGARWADVDYQLAGSNGSRTSRTYTAWAPNILLDWSWRPREARDFHLAGRVSSTFDPVLSETRRMYIFEASLRAHYDVNRCISAYLETGYRHTLLDDTQPLFTNRIHTDFGPWVGLGFDFRM